MIRVSDISALHERALERSPQQSTPLLGLLHDSPFLFSAQPERQAMIAVAAFQNLRGLT